MTIVAVVSAWIWIVPRIAESMLLSQLRHAGFGDASLESIEVGLGHVRVRNLCLGSGEQGVGNVTIATATAEFSATDLLHQRIDSLVLDAPTWTMAPYPELVWSPFDEALRLGSDAAATPALVQVLPSLSVRHVAIHGLTIEPPQSRGTKVKIDAALTAHDGRWSVDVHASMGSLIVSALARLQEQPGQADGTITLRLLGAKPIELEGTCRLVCEPAGRRSHVALQRKPGPFEVALADATWSGDGALALTANVPFAQIEAAAMTLHLEDFELASTTGAQVRGVAAELQFRGLPMPVSCGPQHLRWKHVRVDAVEAGSGGAQCELSSGLELRATIHQRTVDEIGSIDVSELYLAPGVHSFPLTLAFDRVSLQEWLELLSRGRVTGDGRLSGKVALVLHTEPRLSIDLRNGQLAAAPGGVVRFLDDAETAGLVLHHVQQIAESTGHDALVQARLVEALQEFAYTELDFRILPDAESHSVTLQVHAVGEGRRVPQQLDLKVNLHGFDTAVDTAMTIQLGLDRARHRLGGQDR
ncbi:MAG: YdbH domain-containing protein [Planctomycetota bacterium]